ncbi:meiotic recombination protein SPO11 isoform X2 [Nilaparvata lugens]|nr:meiotic recombination protein SPO11 isoform X2 [Nilaparvata lugens]XP_022203441.2 meiotic recombination protein SPO11 isoform X2 [Nilaparvata lugens]XP_039279797.1 meiotic recombination protein SPO11 isoform X2 [Nilaparvata lugens]XP_039279798.1 meiotic recombination protein SPO11 isoform X2 [Nilaparvata lugens]XP_039279800.1 meiotic recombination protein SPO11 isoform X2 [Nilaparvata lugens]XP_039279801.1 meiotic recombination protein SPO11 isoform X2 [Nilaparvata lugens]
MEGGNRCGRSTLMKKIENCTLEIMEKIMENESPSITVRNSKDWRNCDYKEWLTLRSDATETRTSFLNSRERFIRVMHMLNKLHQLLMSNSQCSLRQLYYDDVELYGNQRQSDDILNFICKKLDCMPNNLGIIPNSKGLIAGLLKLKMKHDQIDCSTVGGTKIPDDIRSINHIESNARFILVVEKETVFRKLLDEDISQKLGPCILITGRGFPDLNTRHMLRVLWKKLEIPVFALVDCDPHGIEIMLVYRFGSLSQSQFGEILAVPSMKWLGVQPRDVIDLHIPSIPLTIEEKRNLEVMCDRQYLKSNPQLLLEITKMFESSSKAEIESLYHFSPSYLTNVYLLNKIHSNEFV